MKNYFGLFIVTLATLMYEILLTRIFSVTMFYHFAFMAISVGMFGMTLGAVIVYLNPRYFNTEKTSVKLALSTFLFALSIVVTFLLYIALPVLSAYLIPRQERAFLFNTLVCYVLAGIPFTLSGICVCLALTKLPQPISKLYASDLCGAAFGCLLLLVLLNCFDGASAVLIVAAIACLATLFFSSKENLPRLRLAAVLSIIAFLVLATFNSSLASTGQAPIRVAGVLDPGPAERLYERWNSFSRILIYGNKDFLHRPYAWGLSGAWPQDKK